MPSWGARSPLVLAERAEDDLEAAKTTYASKFVAIENIIRELGVMIIAKYVSVACGRM